MIAILTALALSLSAQAGPAPAAAAKSFGKGITLKQEPITLKEALAKKDELNGKEILVKAKVRKVCQDMGCWFTMNDGPTEVHVTFAHDSFMVPKNSAGDEAVIQGKLFEKELSAAQARYYAKEAKVPAKEVAKITQPVKTPWFEATGLTLTKN
jgi:hypothetical protein